MSADDGAAPVKLGEIPGAVERPDRFPRPRWQVVTPWIERQIAPDQWEAAWQGIAREWLASVAAELGDDYRLFESANFLLLWPGGEREAKLLLEFSERTLERLLHGLEGIASDEGCGKHVLMAFGDVETYYAYIAHFFPEGAYGLTAGQFIDDGYGHIALIPEELWRLEFAVTHELTHACLRHLPLPRWIDEGIAQQMEQSVGGCPPFLLDRELAGRLREYWRRHGLGAFWSGEAFSQPGDAQELSYALAQVLVRLIMEDYPDRWPAFAREASFEDAGESASLRQLGTGLGEIAAGFLGFQVGSPLEERPALAPPRIRRRRRRAGSDS